jgi:hypothetical protein
VPLGLLSRAAPGWHAPGGQMQQRQLEPAGMDGGGREPLLGGEQHVVPRAGQVLGQRQPEIGTHAKGERRAPARQPEAAGQVADSPPPTISSSRAPTANDETADPVPPAGMIN